MQFTVYDVSGHPGGECYLIRTPNSAILCDSGFGFCAENAAERVRNALDGQPLSHILLTHSHYDHVLGAEEIRRGYPGCKIAASREAVAIFAREGARREMGRLDSLAAADAGFPAVPVQTPRVDIPLADGDLLETADGVIEAIATPGHTRCSMSFYHRGLELLIASETSGTATLYPEITPGYIISYRQSIESIDRCAAYHPKHLLLPHTGLHSDQQVPHFFSEARKAAELSAAFILKRHRQGLSPAEIVAAFRDTYYLEEYRGIMPERAFLINTEAMVSRLLREVAE